MDTILLLTTGGTIDMRYGAEGLYVGEPVAPSIVRNVLFKGDAVTLVHQQICRKDSRDLTDHDREAIARACTTDGPARILITHGTDTMQKTAAALAHEPLAAGKTIVLTGAFQPAAMRDTDAYFNLGLAVGRLVSRPPAGVYIALNGIHKWNECRKNVKKQVFERVTFGFA